MAFFLYLLRNIGNNSNMTELPTIKIKEVQDVTYSTIEMDVPDAVYDKIVKIGREEATASDFFKIGFISVLEESLSKDDERAE